MILLGTQVVKMSDGSMTTLADIASGSGGGSKYEEETLYSGVESQTSYTLSKSISNYDLIGIRCARSNNIEIYNIFPASYLIASITTQQKIGLTTDDKYTFFKVTNETTLTKQEESDLHIVGVIGIIIGTQNSLRLNKIMEVNK